MTDVLPIPTRYKGYHFRSRLEARWAVFFNTLGIKWEYELDGYVVGPPHDRQLYLPDFWLPGENCWAEVKGPLDSADIAKMYYGSIPEYGLPGNKHGIRLLLLGSIPNPGVSDHVWHHTIAYCTYTHDSVPALSPGLYSRSVAFGQAEEAELDEFSGPDRFFASAQLWGIRAPSVSTRFTSVWNFNAFVSESAGSWGAYKPCPPRVRQAYLAARSARFEHGESGAS